MLHRFNRFFAHSKMVRMQVGPTYKGNLQSVSTSQEALDVTATSGKYDSGEQITENNAFLAALYSKPSAAKPSTKLSV